MSYGYGMAQVIGYGSRVTSYNNNYVINHLLRQCTKFVPKMERTCTKDVLNLYQRYAKYFAYLWHKKPAIQV